MAVTRGYFKAFNREKKILQTFGVYPVEDADIKFSPLRFFVCFTINSIQLILMMMLLVVKDIRNFLEAWHFITITITMLFKISMFVIASKDMKDIENYLKNFETAELPDGLVDFVIGETYFRNRFYMPQWIMVICGITVQFATCVIFHKLRLLLIISWSPFDLQEPLYYFLTITFQLIFVLFNALPNLAIDTMYYVLVDIACCELDVLIYKFTNLDPLKNPDKTIDELKDNVICHQTIIRFITIMQNNIYSELMFLQCIGSIIVICVLGFQFTMTKNWFLFIQHMVYCTSMIFQIFCYTWFGEKFTGKSQEITQACYMSRWNECDIKIQKMLINIMTRAKKPLYLTSYIFDFTLGTFLRILKSSYSYMAVLNTMYNE